MSPAEARIEYLRAAHDLRALYGPAMVDADTFAARSKALHRALEGLDVAPDVVAHAKRITESTLRAAQGSPLFKAIVGHHLKQLRTAGVLPASQHEDEATTFARLSSLAEIIEAAPASSRRTTHVAEAPPIPAKTVTLMKQVEATLGVTVSLPQATSGPSSGAILRADPAQQRDSLFGHIDEGRRLVVLEEPADSNQLVPIKSNYRVHTRPIGEGGVGKVYAGRDVDTGLRVAVKVVTIPNADKRVEYLALFQNEREIQGSLDDDAIVRIYKTGMTGHGEPYIVMELLTGGSLSDLIDDFAANKRRFVLDDVRHFAAMAISAVAVAHRRGVLHKDIKPENFLFTEDHRRLKLGDFGISERADAASKSINGTIGFMPPETYEGTGDTETRDVFALGVSLYMLFTGRMPFAADDAASSYYDMKGRIPTPPSAVRPDRNLGAHVNRIVLKALSADRALRYANADEMLFDFVTSEVSASLDAARAELASADPSDLPTTIAREKMWTQAMREAIRALERIEDTYPGDRVRQWRVSLLAELYAHAGRVGDEELVRMTVETIAHLDPKNDVIQDAASGVVIDFFFDDPAHLLRRARAEFTVVESSNRAGIIEATSIETSPHFLRTLELPRGRIVGLGVRGDGIHPIFIPLPVRPGRHRVRIPIYGAAEIPRGMVIVPAGTVPSRNRRGSYSEEIASEDVRRVDHDFAIGNLVSNAEWLAYLSLLTRDGDPNAARARRPGNWVDGPRGPILEDGSPIDFAAPLRFVGYDDVIAYLARMLPGARLPTLHEIKRTGRGNDARTFPWGDAVAQKPSMAAFQYVGHAVASAPMPSIPRDARFADRSPFSVPDGKGGFTVAAYHLVGNVSEILSLGASFRDRAPILRAFPATRGLDPDDDTLGERIFVTYGLPYNTPAPTTPDIIGIEEWPEDPSRRMDLPHGFRALMPLRRVE